MRSLARLLAFTVLICAAPAVANAGHHFWQAPGSGIVTKSGPVQYVNVYDAVGPWAATSYFYTPAFFNLDGGEIMNAMPGHALAELSNAIDNAPGTVSLMFSAGGNPDGSPYVSDQGSVAFFGVNGIAVAWCPSRIVL